MRSFITCWIVSRDGLNGDIVASSVPVGQGHHDVEGCQGEHDVE